MAGVAGELGRSAPTQPLHSLADAREWVPALRSRGPRRRAWKGGRLVGGASPGRRRLPAGTALCRSPTRQPARRRSEASLPAFPSWSPNGSAPSPPPLPSTETPRSSQPRIPAPRRRQSGGAGSWSPQPLAAGTRPSGTRTARVSLRRRAFRPAAPGGAIVPSRPGRGGSQELSRTVCLSVRELPAAGSTMSLTHWSSSPPVRDTPASRA